MQSVLTGPASHLCQQQQQRRQQHAFAVTSGRCLVECEGRLPPAYRSATGSGSGSAHLLFSCGHTRSPVRAAGVRNHAVLDFTPIARQVRCCHQGSQCVRRPVFVLALQMLFSSYTFSSCPLLPSPAHESTVNARYPNMRVLRTL